MIELRPRKRSRLHSSVSGSDRAEGDAPEEAEPSVAESGQQVPGGTPCERDLVRKRGRKVTIRRPDQCTQKSEGTQIGLGEASRKGGDGLLVRSGCPENTLLSRQLSKRQRKPKLGACCSQPACASDYLCQQKKRGRKPKAKPSEITTSGQGQGHGGVTAGNKRRITSVSLGRLKKADNRQAGSAQSSVASGQVKKRGRKPKIQPSAKQGDLGSGNGSAVTSAGSRVIKLEPGSQPERKAGSLPQKTVKGVRAKSGHEKKGYSRAGKDKIHTIHVRVQRSSLSRVSKKTVVSSEPVKNQHPDPLQGEESISPTEPSGGRTEPRNSRRTKRVDPISCVEKRKIPVAAEQNMNCLMTACDQSSVLKVEEEAVNSNMSEGCVTKCLNRTCHVHSPNLPNPVVRLQNCKGLHLPYPNKKTVEPGNMLTTLDVQNPISPSDDAAKDSVSISAKENVNHNEVVESTSVVKNRSPIKQLLRLKLDFRKRKKKTSSPSEESDIELKTIDRGGKKLKREGNQHRGDCIAEPKLSTCHNGTLMDKLNNNTIMSAGLNPTKEESIVGTNPISNLWDIWRTQAPFVSDEEISDHDLGKSTSLTVCSSNFSPSKEGPAVTCQRVIPFTGKTIWKCSCARTYVSALPRKRAVAVQNTTILGIDAERSLEVYPNDADLLFESIGEESAKERTEENESECKRRNLDIPGKSTSPHNCASFESTLNESFSSENKCMRDALLSTSETRDASLNLPSEPSWKDLGVNCSEYSTPDMATNDEHQIQQLKIENKTHLASNSPSEMEQKTEIGPVLFKIPTEETRTLLHGRVPVVCSINKDLQNEVCSQSTLLEEVDTSVLSDNLLSGHRDSESEDGKSNCFTPDWFDKGDLVKHEEAFDTSVTHAPASTKKFTNRYTVDLMKAYEEDILVIDVIQDDPELFDVSIEGERNINNNVTNSKPRKIPLISKVQKKGVPPACESKTFIPRIEYLPESTTDLTNDLLDTGSDQQDAYESFPETNEIGTHAEIEESRGPAESQNKDSRQELHHVNMLEESTSSPSFQEVFPSKHLSRPQQSFLYQPKSESSIMNSPSPWIHDFPSNRMETSLPDVAASDNREKWKQENSNTRMQQSWLPYGYCKFFFNTFSGCKKIQCSYFHVPNGSDEKLCMDLLHKLINENKAFLLKRAVWIFRNFYSRYPPGLHYDTGIFGALLNPLLNLSFWHDLFTLLETAATAKIFPSIEQIIKLFEGAAFSGLTTATLLDIFCKFVHKGMNISPMEINHIITILRKSNAAENHINILLSMKSSLAMRISKPNWAYDMDAAMSEVEQCKVNSDWMRLGTLHLTACTGCENLTNLNNLSRGIAEALMKDSINEVPFCEFADAIFKNPQFDDIQKNTLGRIGISVMFFYHHKELWLKGRKVIYKLHELKINYTVLKGLCGQGSIASRCHVINIAVEIFLKSGNLVRAIQTLKECDWIINTSMWPCERMDVLHRHNLLCLLVQEAMSRRAFNLSFDVLQNMPGFKESQADVNVSQYAVLFNKVLNACVENRTIGMSSSIIDFMIARKIAIDYFNLRGHITSLGHSSLWNKARGYYKSALALGFYPLFEGKMNPKILYIPSFMSEVEMLMTIEQFMVSNASSVQLQGGCNQSLQIVLKRMEDDAKCKDSYHAAAERLFEASRLCNPKLFIKHTTVNNTNEQVYTLDNNSSLKWLNENMKWASNVWYY